MIKERFLYFKTVDAFAKKQAQGDINSTSIVFIEEVQSIITYDNTNTPHIFGTWNGKEKDGSVVINEESKDISQLDSSIVDYVSEQLKQYYTKSDIIGTLSDYYTKDEVYSKDEVDDSLEDINDKFFDYYTKDQTYSKGEVYTKEQIDGTERKEGRIDAKIEEFRTNRLEPTLKNIADEIESVRNSIPEQVNVQIPEIPQSLSTRLENIEDSVILLNRIDHSQFITEHQDISGITTNAQDISELKLDVQELQETQLKNEHSKGFFSNVNELPVTGEDGDWAMVSVGGAWYLYRYNSNATPNWVQGEEFTITVPTQVNADWNSTSGLSRILNKPNLAQVALSGSYNDLTNKPTIPIIPTIPTKLSDFVNDTGFITQSDIPEVTGNVNEEQLQDYVKKEDVYTPGTSEYLGVVGNDQPGAEPNRAPAFQAYDYATFDFVEEYVPSVVEQTLAAAESGQSLESQPKNIVLSTTQYEQLTTYEPGVLYFVYQAQEQTNWTFGGTFPITFTADNGIGTFPITLTGDNNIGTFPITLQ